jgi:hypothetical protein
MLLRLFYVFIALATVLQSRAQINTSSPNALLNKFNALNAVADENEKLYLLKLYADEWVDLIAQPGFEFPDTLELAMKKMDSPNKTLSVYYFVPSLKNQHRIDLFVAFERHSVRYAYHFPEPLQIKSPDKGTLAIALELKLNEIVRNQISYYQLQVVNTPTGQVVADFTDLYTQCLFEEIALLRNDTLKANINREIIERMQPLWEDATLFDHPFTGFRRMSTLLASGKTVKVCTWGYQQSDHSFQVAGSIIYRDKGRMPQVTLLNDDSPRIKNPERSNLNAKRWYGAVYTGIVEHTFKGESVFTLLGFKTQDEFTKIKLIDVFTLENGVPRFGSAIVQKGQGFANRVIFEYSSETNMMLRYDATHKMIVMDHLAPSDPAYRGVYRFYGPDFSYDGYKFSKGKWELVTDIDLRNPAEPKMKMK